MEEKNFTFGEIADLFGMSEEELIDFAKKRRIIDESGLPTQKAIDEGLFTIETTFSMPHSLN